MYYINIVSKELVKKQTKIKEITMDYIEFVSLFQDLYNTVYEEQSAIYFALPGNEKEVYARVEIVEREILERFATEYPYVLKSQIVNHFQELSRQTNIITYYSKEKKKRVFSYIDFSKVKDIIEEAF